MIIFNRKAGIVLVTSDEDFLRLELSQQLGAKYVASEWERVGSMSGHVRIRAVRKGHLDVTTIPDPRLLHG